MTGKACFVQCLTVRFAVLELSKPPARRRGVFLRILDHELEIRRGPGNERLFSAKDRVVLGRWDVLPGKPRNHRAIRERTRSVSKCFDRDVVSENDTDIIEISGFGADFNKGPVTVPGGNF